MIGIRKCFAFAFINLFPIILFSQSQLREKNWVLGDSVSIAFSPNPTVNPGKSNFSPVSSACISDHNGNLLFYVGRIDNVPINNLCYKVWNSYNILIQNGDSLQGIQGSFQGCLIIPSSKDSNCYFIFHLDRVPGLGFKCYESLLNLDSNNGMGTIIFKNIKVSDSIFHEPIWAIKHGNGRDWWLLFHKFPGNEFVEYLLSNDSLIYWNTQPIGNNCGSYTHLKYKTNRNGNKLILACSDGVLDLFDFDRCSGLLSNWIPLSDPPFNEFLSYYGTAFSEDDTKLYANKIDSLFQFDLNSANIKASRYWLFTTDSNYYLADEKLGLDGRIYIAGGGKGNIFFSFDSLNTHLGVINYPNSQGSACNFAPYSFSLGGRRSFWSLPNMPNYDLEALSGSICDSLSVGITEPSKSKVSFSVFPNPANDFIEFHSSAPISSFNIYNTLGLEVLKPCLAPEKQIAISALPPGIYFIKAYIKNGNAAIAKFVKMEK